MYQATWAALLRLYRHKGGGAGNETLNSTRAVFDSQFLSQVFRPCAEAAEEDAAQVARYTTQCQDH